MEFHHLGDIWGYLGIFGDIWGCISCSVGKAIVNHPQL